MLLWDTVTMMAASGEQRFSLMSVLPHSRDRSGRYVHEATGHSCWLDYIKGVWCSVEHTGADSAAVVSPIALLVAEVVLIPLCS